MTPLISLAKLVGGPGSLRLLAILLLLGLTWSLVWPKRPRSGATWIAVIVVAYLVMALPAVAVRLVDGLPAAPIVDDARIREIRTLFFFDGDNRFGRLREFERVYALAHPSHVFLLGRLSVYKDLLLMEIPRASLHHETGADNTSAQVARVQTLLAGGVPGPSAILVSRLQSPRVAGFITAAGIQSAIISGPLDDELPRAGVARWLPSLSALAVTRDCVYEIAALHYYR